MGCAGLVEGNIKNTPRAQSLRAFRGSGFRGLRFMGLGLSSATAMRIKMGLASTRCLGVCCEVADGNSDQVQVVKQAKDPIRRVPEL